MTKNETVRRRELAELVERQRRDQRAKVVRSENIRPTTRRRETLTLAEVKVATRAACAEKLGKRMTSPIDVQTRCRDIVRGDLEAWLANEGLPRREPGARRLSRRALLVAYFETFRPLPMVHGERGRLLSARDYAWVSLAGGNWPKRYGRAFVALVQSARKRTTRAARIAWMVRAVVKSEEAAFKDLIDRQGRAPLVTGESLREWLATMATLRGRTKRKPGRRERSMLMRRFSVTWRNDRGLPRTRRTDH